MNDAEKYACVKDACAQIAEILKGVEEITGRAVDRIHINETDVTTLDDCDSRIYRSVFISLYPGPGRWEAVTK